MHYEVLMIILLGLSILFLVWCLIDTNRKIKIGKDDKLKKRKKQLIYNVDLLDDENINNIF